MKEEHEESMETELPLEQEQQDDLVAEITKLKEEISELNDRLLRNAAETENMRKRYEKQIEESKLYSISNFAKDLLSVLDNLSRALEHKPAEMPPEIENIIKVVDMTLHEMINVLSKHKMIAISPSTGEKFDYNLHYAVTQVPSNEHPAGTVLQLVQNGYMIGERLLRPAAVTVTKSQDDA